MICCALDNVHIVLFNVNMARKTRIKPTARVKGSHSDALRILASLIAQFHVKKITRDKKTETENDTVDFGDMNNG